MWLVRCYLFDWDVVFHVSKRTLLRDHNEI